MGEEYAKVAGRKREDAETPPKERRKRRKKETN